ncbi:MAG TPA: BcsE family c-di-GMP-binding protein, partial [Burkholderiaceae bacterium]
VVLVFSGSAAFDPLARCIHGLRARCGPRLKIVVRELNLRLRYSQEALLLRLGANLIVPAEVGFARFLGLAGMVQGQVYAHPIVPSYEAAVADATPEKEQGYLPPAAFIQAVAAMLDASRALNMQEVLVRMPLGYGLQPLDALRYCAIKRAGDLCTADDQSVYLFLHACREGDVDMTLERLFKLPVAEFFSSESRYFSPDQIQHAIDELQQRCHHGAYPDLSTELARASLQPQPAIAGPALQAENAAAPARGAPTAVRYAAPPAAERRPLKMRGAPTLVEIGSLNK